MVQSYIYCAYHYILKVKMMTNIATNKFNETKTEITIDKNDNVRLLITEEYFTYVGPSETKKNSKYLCRLCPPALKKKLLLSLSFETELKETQ